MRSNPIHICLLLLFAGLGLCITWPLTAQEAHHHEERHQEAKEGHHEEGHHEEGHHEEGHHGEGHHDPGHSATEPGPEVADVILPAPFRQLLVREMAELEGAMVETQAYLIRGDLERAAEVAERIRDSLVLHQEMTPEELRELVSLLPSTFLQLDRKFHGTAGRLAKAARAGQPGEAAALYAQMTQACIQCHGRFAAWRFPRLREPSGPTWSPRPSGTDASLRGLHGVSENVAWATGTGGTVLRTTNGGQTWELRPVAGAAELDFRDVEAWDANTALVLTAGQPARIYRTEDGGASFTLVHESPHGDAFFDGMDFWDAQRGLVYSDPVAGRFLVLTTVDGGRTWQEAEGLPQPVEGEAGFAASGTNVAVGPGGHAWIGTGGQVARVLRTTDGGKTWEVAPSPLRQGSPSTGIFSIAFRDDHHGLIAGGDYLEPENPTGNLARSTDGGRTWKAIPGPPPAGHRAVVAWLPKAGPTAWLAVGRAGADLSTDDGLTWQPLGEEGFYTVSVAADGAVWAAGAEGRIARLMWNSMTTTATE